MFYNYFGIFGGKILKAHRVIVLSTAEWKQQSGMVERESRLLPL